MRALPDRVLLGPVLGLAAVIVLSVAAAVSYVSESRWIDHTLEIRHEANEWTIALLDAEAGVRGYVVSGQSTMLSPYEASLPRLRTQGLAMARLAADNPAQAHNVELAERHAQAATRSLAELVALVGSGRRDAALAQMTSGEGERLMADFRADARAIQDEEARLLVARRANADVLALGTMIGGLLLMAASVASLGLAWTVQRRRTAALDALAKQSERRLEVLARVAAALAEVRTPAEVARIVVDQGARALEADTCTVYMLDASGTELQLVGERGVAKPVVDKIARLTETSGNPRTFATLKTGESLWAENEADYLALFPELANVKTVERRAKAFWSMPLVVEGKPVGLLGMGFYEPHALPADERAFIATFTQQCAQALVRATHQEREDEARRWFATALRSVGDAVIATDADGQVTFMNAVAERLTGWPLADARRQRLEDVFAIFSERTRKPVENPVAKVLRDGVVVGLANHTVLRSRGGDEIPIDDSAAPIRDESGRLFGVVMVFRDVTKEKRDQAERDFLARAGEALASSLDPRTTLATVVQFAVPELADWCAVELLEPGAKASQQVAVAHVDPGKVRLARELGERYPPDPDAATGVPQVLRTGKSELYTEIPPSLIEAGARDAEHLEVLRALGLRSAMVVPLRSRGRVRGALIFIYAESGRRYTERDLAFAEDFARRAGMAIDNALSMKETEDARARERALRADAEVASRAKDEFLATVSHELRTPLNAILGWTVTLRGRSPAPEVDRPLAVIERNARVQKKLIEDVLDVSRIISGKLALSLGPTNVAEAIAASIETVTPAAEAKGIALTTDIENDAMNITADADRLQQIVWNLLTNAVKFTPKGGTVSVHAYRSGSSICIRVVDTGEGMRPETLAVVFEPFKQADASTTRRHGGLGLGLAIVKQLVVAHGGTVEAHSDGEGKGASFVVCLPARSAVPAVRSNTPPGSPSQVPRLEGLRVLAVDDEEDARLLVGTMLRQQGAEVHLASSADEAIEILARVRPDVVVSDIGMPHTDGYALIRTVRGLSTALGGRTPAVALTAYAQADDARRALASGFQAHLAKPVELLQLATVVANLGGRGQPS